MTVGTIPLRTLTERYWEACQVLDHTDPRDWDKRCTYSRFLFNLVNHGPSDQLRCCASTIIAKHKLARNKEAL